MEPVELVQPTTFAGFSNRLEAAIESPYWEFDAKKSRKPNPMEDRDAFKWAVREMLLRIRNNDS